MSDSQKYRDFKRDFAASSLEERLFQRLRRAHREVGDAQCLVGKCRLDQSALGGSGLSSEGELLAIEDPPGKQIKNDERYGHLVSSSAFLVLQNQFISKNL